MNSILSELVRVIGMERDALLTYACYRLGNRSDAEDVLHDCYLRLHERFTDGQEGAKMNIRNYVFRSLSNLCTDRLADRTRHLTVDLGQQDVEETDTDNRESEYCRITSVLDKIPEEQAEVIRLRMYGNRSFAEISNILQVPLSTAKSRFLYGIEKIRKAMKPRV
ncbi:MAG: RNA polymerase sigma factor [Bacteroidales bacterium]|nr:RNA polymerase sigma factor [Bacteroidales bacterium]